MRKVAFDNCGDCCLFGTDGCDVNLCCELDESWMFVEDCDDVKDYVQER
jgi:hypothetical protein